MGVAMAARQYDVIVIGAGSTGENVGPTTTFSQQEGRMCLRCADTGHVDRPVVARRGFLKLAGGAAVGFAVAGRAFAEEAKRPPKPENVISPDAALRAPDERQPTLRGRGRTTARFQGRAPSAVDGTEPVCRHPELRRFACR